MYAAAAAAKSLQSCLTLCDPIDGSPPGSSVPGILQARILEWVAISYFRGCSCPTDQTHVSRTSHINRWILYHCTTWKAPLCLDSLNFIRTIIRAYLSSKLSILTVCIFLSIFWYYNLIWLKLLPQLI